MYHIIRFHVQDLSSAHVYLRLKKNEKLEDVPNTTLMECAQLVKANSIEGCKLNHVHISKLNIAIVYYVLFKKLSDPFCHIFKLCTTAYSIYEVAESEKDCRYGSGRYRIPR